MTEDDVAGTIEVVDEDGTFELPDRYYEADAVVIRDPSKTVNMPSGAPKREWYYDPRPDRNPSLSPDKVSLKIHGEDAEVFRVDGIERIDAESTDTP